MASWKSYFSKTETHVLRDGRPLQDVKKLWTIKVDSMNSKGGHRFGQFLIQKNLSRTEMTFSFYAFAPNKSRGWLFTAMFPLHVRQTRIAAVVGVFSHLCLPLCHLHFRLWCYCVSIANQHWIWNPIGQSYCRRQSCAKGKSSGDEIVASTGRGAEWAKKKTAERQF